MILGVQLEQDKLKLQDQAKRDADKIRQQEDLQKKLKVRVVFMSRCMNTCSYDLCAGRVAKRERAAA